LPVVATDKNTKNLLKNIVEIEKSLKDRNKTKQRAQNKVTEIPIPLNKKHIMQLIKRCHGDKLYISQYKAPYLVKKLQEKFPTLVWPLKIPRLIILPPNINLDKINDKNKIKNLANIIQFLEANQHNFEKHIMTNIIPKFNSRTAVTRQTHEAKKNSFRPTLNADLKNIYEKLKANNIIQKNKMKVETPKLLLLYEDYEIIALFSSIAKNILNYFSCCDNFSKVKSIVSYFVRLSLAATLMQKHRMPSIHNVLKKYGENISVEDPCKKNQTVNFFTKHEINIWPRGFNKKNSSITYNYPF
jgi:hypothetical protein